MSVSEDLQRLSMIELLPHLLAGGDAANIDKAVPNNLQALPNGGPEFHIIASNTFRTILEEKLVPPSSFTQTFLPSIVASIECRDPCTSEAWLQTLLDITELLPPDVVKTDVLPVAVSRGQLSQSTQSRVSSCKLLGRIAKKFDSTLLRKEVIPLVHSLCQDVCGEVRASMCQQLPFIARGLNPDAVKPDLLPLFVDLAIDEEPAVRLAAVHTISCVIPILPGDVLKHTIVPLIMKLCEEAFTAEDNVLSAISEKYGELCNGMKGVLSENDKVWFLQYFKKLAKLGIGKAPAAIYDMKNLSEYVREKEHCEFLMQCRQNAAANFSATVRFSGPSLFEETLYSTFAAMVCDQSSNVRSCIAGGIHEIFYELGSKCHLVQSELMLLLTDDSLDVLQALVPHLHLTLQHLTKSCLIGPSVVDSVAHELMRALLKCELVLSLCNNWRLHSAMLGQLEHTPGAFSSDLIFSNVCGVLFHRIQDSRALPCRLAAAHALLVVLRHTSKVEHRNEIRNRIFTELCIHHSCHVRLLFVKMCGMALDLFSSFYFKEHFFLRLLSLAGDPVPNVRLVLCDLLPRLKGLLKIPQDNNLQSALQDAIERLQTSVRPDRDVAAKLRAAYLEMDRMSTNSVNAEDLSRYQEEQEIEMKNSIPEPRRLVTVNMKTLGEGKRATLVSLCCPDVSRSDYRQSNGGNIAVSSYGGYPSMESKITASISSTSSDSSLSFSNLASTQKEISSSNNSWSHLLTRGSRLPVPLTNTSRAQVSPKSPLSVSGMNMDVTTVCMLLTQCNTDISSAYPDLREEEFYIDAGVPLPENLTEMKLTSANLGCSDPVRSKIPNLRELLFQNSTLLAQVASREAQDTSLKSVSYLKTIKNKSSSRSDVNKRYSRLFSENSSVSDFKNSSLIGRPSSAIGVRRDSSSSLSMKSGSEEVDGVQVRIKEESQFNSKAVSSSSPRATTSRKDSKIGSPGRRSLVYPPNQVDVGDKDRYCAGAVKHGRLERSLSPATSSAAAGAQDMTDMSSSSPSKLRNGIAGKSSVSFSQNHPLAGATRSFSSISKVSAPKLPFSETLLARRASVDLPEAPLDQDHPKFVGSHVANKRFSLRERSQIQGPPGAALEKKVSLSSIGVNGMRRVGHPPPGSRPQSCLVLTQSDRPGGGKVVNSARSLSQESLGLLESGRMVGARGIAVAQGRAGQVMSRIPRGGTVSGGPSCHSSPGNSRCVSPTNNGLVTRTAPGSRSTSPSRAQAHARVSLASIKLHEPSKLPIRKYNHHV